MARRLPGPVPPRASAPDLPPVLDGTSEVRARSELFAMRLIDLPARVEAAHARIVECAVPAASVDRLDLTGATLVDVALDDLRATEVIARDGSWRNVAVTGGRIGTLDLQRVEWQGVTLRGLRIDYLSAPAAVIADLDVVDCVIGTMDLPEAALTRVRFVDCRVDEVDTRGLRASDLDLRGLEALSYTDARGLRGATLTELQAQAHAVALAAALGIEVAE